MGLQLPLGEIARYKAAAFGPSKCPALFKYVKNEFAYLLHLQFLREGLIDIIIITYVDDALLATPTFPQL